MGVWEDDEEEEEKEGECWDEEDGYLVIKYDKGGSEKLSRVDVGVTTTCTTLAEAVDQALDSRNFRSVYDLIDGGHSVNQIITDNGSSLIHRAAKYGCIGFAQNLLRLGAKVNMLRLDGVSPLLLASQEGHLGVVKLLIKAGAKVDVSIGGYTPLYLAVQQGHTKIVKELLLANSSPNTAVLANGLTPLHSACFKGYVEIVKMLLLKGADYKAQAKDGATPMNFATAHEDTTIKNLLLEIGKHEGTK